MRAPHVVVAGVGSADPEGDAVLRGLSPHFVVRRLSAVCRDPDRFRGARCLIVVGDLPPHLSEAGHDRRGGPPVVWVPPFAELDPGVEEGGGITMVSMLGAREHLPRVVAALAIDDLFTRCQRAAATAQVLDRHDLVRVFLTSLFGSSPAPAWSVKRAASLVNRCPDWVTRQWSEMSAGADARVPPLPELQKCCRFLRALSMRLKDADVSLEEASKQVAVTTPTLRSYYMRYTGRLPGALRIEDVNALLCRLEEEVFGWLLGIEAARRRSD